MTEFTVQYWPKDKPIPAGWKLVNSLSDCHHGLYSVLIRQTEVARQNLEAAKALEPGVVRMLYGQWVERKKDRRSLAVAMPPGVERRSWLERRHG